MSRFGVVVAALVLSGGCFVDAVGLGPSAGDGGAGSTTASGQPTSATGTTATDASTTTATTATTAMTTTGGGGEGGMGGAPCPDSVLTFDGDDIAGVNDDDFDIADDFAVGAWIYAAQNIAFVAGDGDDEVSLVLSHGSLDDLDGYGIGITENGDAGAPFVTFAVFPSGVLCLATAAIQWNQWTHVAGSYLNATGDDVRLYVNGAQVATGNCTIFQPPVSYDGPFLLGGDGQDPTRAFQGSIDDVYVKHGTTLPDFNDPVACGPEFVAVFSFENGLVSSCANMTPLAADPAPNDPQIDCMQ